MQDPGSGGAGGNRVAAYAVAGVEKIGRTHPALLYTWQAAYGRECGKAANVGDTTSKFLVPYSIPPLRFVTQEPSLAPHWRKPACRQTGLRQWGTQRPP